MDRAIKRFLFPRVYRHPQVVKVRREAERVVRDLYGHYCAHPEEMPEEWCADLGSVTTGCWPGSSATTSRG